MNSLNSFSCASAIADSTAHVSGVTFARMSFSSRDISSCLTTHESFVKANQRIPKLPIRRAALTVQQVRDQALTCSTSDGDLRLSKSAPEKVFDDFAPVHGRIITYVIGESKHHRDCLNTDNHGMDTLAQRLVAKREALGLSQQELAKKAKLKSQSIIGMLESGARKSSSHIPAIANALGVESLWLSSGIGPESRSSAKTYELSEAAMKIALLVNAMSEEKQIAMLNFLTAEQIRTDDKASVTQRQLIE